MSLNRPIKTFYKIKTFSDLPTLFFLTYVTGNSTLILLGLAINIVTSSRFVSCIRRYRGVVWWIGAVKRWVWGGVTLVNRENI